VVRPAVSKKKLVHEGGGESLEKGLRCGGDLKKKKKMQTFKGPFKLGGPEIKI